MEEKKTDYGMMRVAIGPGDEGKRFDAVARKLLPGLPLSAVFKGIRSGRLRLNGARAKPERRLEPGDVIECDGSLAADAKPSLDAKPRRQVTVADEGDRPALVTLAETDDLAFVDKPKGMLTHGPGGLDEIVRARYRDATRPSISFEPAPLHRLDRNTSGIVAVSKTISGAREFSRLLREGRIRKLYFAVLEGELSGAEEWRDELARDDAGRTTNVGPGLIAVTRVEPVAVSGGYTFAAVRIETGRTHQIRAQAAAHGHPLAGDAKYGGRPFRDGYLLHAAGLRLSSPSADPIAAACPAAVVCRLPSGAAETVRRLFGIDPPDPADFA